MGLPRLTPGTRSALTPHSRERLPGMGPSGVTPLPCFLGLERLFLAPWESGAGRTAAACLVAVGDPTCSAACRTAPGSEGCAGDAQSLATLVPVPGAWGAFSSLHTLNILIPPYIPWGP